MNGITDVRELRSQLDTILNRLKVLLNKDPLVDFGWEVEIIRVTEFMVQIEMTHNKLNKSVEVDLLPTFDAGVYNSKLLELYHSYQVS
jgi:hypothetical protein